MDIPEIVNRLPADVKEDVVKCLRVLKVSGVFDSMIDQCVTEVLQAAMVLAHNRDYEAMERVAIKTAAISEMVAGINTAIEPQQEN